jgi:hypothetical protein
MGTATDFRKVDLLLAQVWPHCGAALRCREKRSPSFQPSSLINL